MKPSTVVALSHLLIPAAAYPQLLGSILGDAIGTISQDAIKALNSTVAAITPSFNARAQLIDVTGRHAFQAPGPNDARGPCPGLNALANHGYLPRNGNANIVELTTACTNVYGMGPDLSAILAAYGAVLDGTGVSWSIGGQQHTGISGSHNNYETDSSPMRGDLDQYGSNTDLVLSQFEELLNLQPDPATANYDLNVLTTFRASRYNQSVAQNPNFYYGPFTGTTVSQAAFAFIYRLMANHTAERPDGILNQDVLKSFFAITSNASAPSGLTWTPGYERIPDNWYKRDPNGVYGLDSLSDDIDTMAAQHPEFTTPGCNQGRVNSFVAIVDPQTEPSAYDFAHHPLRSGVCFAVADAIAAASLVPIVPLVVEELLVPVQNLLGCPLIQGSNATIGSTCPGYSTYGGPTGPVAEGAVQS